jgi:hypothetical protein
MNECRKARKQLDQALAELEQTLKSFNKTITIRF